MRTLFVMVVVVWVAACGDNQIVDPPDASFLPRIDAKAMGGADGGVVSEDAAPPSDAEILAACSEVCPEDNITPWPGYDICLPSYRHCALLPSCDDCTVGATLNCGKTNQCTCTIPSGAVYSCANHL